MFELKIRFCKSAVYRFRCWLSKETGLIWAFVGPTLAIVLVSNILSYLTVFSEHLIQQISCACPSVIRLASL